MSPHPGAHGTEGDRADMDRATDIKIKCVHYFLIKRVRRTENEKDAGQEDPSHQPSNHPGKPRIIQKPSKCRQGL